MSPGSKLATPRGWIVSIDLHRPTIGKTKKLFFSETTRPTALLFGM